ncbi:MAG: hypothetical protein ACFB6S_01730 [Geminicoccaceae bacterium]
MHLGLLVLARTTFDTAFARSLIDQALEVLGEHELTGSPEMATDLAMAERVLASINPETIDAMLVLQATFTDAEAAEALADHLPETVPIWFWSFPEPRAGGRLRLNGLCGVNLAAHALARRGRALAFRHEPPEKVRSTSFEQGLRYGKSPQPLVPEEQAELYEADRIVDRLKTRTFAKIGNHPAGFTTCAVDPGLLRERLGVKVTTLELDALFQAAREAAADESRKLADSRYGGLDRVDAEATTGTLKLHRALSDRAARQEIAGFAVRCWPETFERMGCAACGAMAMLSEDRIPCACEADVLGGITNWLLQEVAGEPAFLADLVDVDEDTAVFWHCGLAPVSMASSKTPPVADIHSNRRKPLLGAFALKPGRFTLARLSLASGELSLVLGAGEMLDEPMSFSGTSGVARFDEAAPLVLDRLIALGLEHHTSLVYGDHVPMLEAIAQHLQLPVFHLCRG